MPTNKDFKRLVRARMTKTGESYTAARARLHPPATPSPKQPPVATPDFATIAGMSDAAVKAKTGCAWDRWVWALDKAGAHGWDHARIARHLREKYKVSAWWNQMIAVGYERIRGLRVVGQRRDGGFTCTKSRTFALPLTRLYRAFKDKRTRDRWLPGITLRVTSATANKYLRIVWSDGSKVAVGFYGKGPGKSQVQVEHNGLTDQAAATRLKDFWSERLAALASLQEKRPGK